MPLIHHVITNPPTDQGRPPIVFVHGFACAHSDWNAQVAHLAARHICVGVDLRGHGASPGTAEECSVERYGADVAEVLRALALPPAVLMGHSMGCRVVTEAALQAPAHTAAVILVDGSQFAAGMGETLRAIFATPDGFATLTDSWFNAMFTPKSDPATVAAVAARAARLPRAIGEKMLTDMQRYDVTRFASALADLRVPVMALQTTTSNERRERQPLSLGQTTPYLDMLRARIPNVRVDIIPDTGHFPQLDEAARTNALIDSFLAALPGA